MWGGSQSRIAKKPSVPVCATRPLQLELGEPRAAKLQRHSLPDLVEGVHYLLLCEVRVRLRGAYLVGRDFNLVNLQRNRHTEEARQLLDRLRVACIRSVPEEITLPISDRVGVQWYHKFTRREALD